MADFSLAISKTLIREGGARITNIAADKGGLTKYGISQVAYPQLDIKNLTESQAFEIYKNNYWDLVRGDKINNQLVAESIFDFAVNSGAKSAIKLVQIVVGFLASDVDGVAGEETISAINAMPAEQFIPLYKLEKISRYAHLCNVDSSQSKFLLGWINRTLGAA